MPLPALRAFPLALLLGAVAACGFAPLDLWPLTFLCFAGLVLLVRQAPTGRNAAAIGWWFGLGHFAAGLNWIATAFTFQAAMPAWLGWIAVLIVALGLAVYVALAACSAWWIARPAASSGPRRDLALVLVFAGTWILAEWLRATVLTGFAWNPLGVVWVTLTPLARAGRWIGTYGLSGLAMLVSGGLAMAYLTGRRAIADGRRSKLVLLIALPAAVIIALAPGIVFDRFYRRPSAPNAPWLHVVQPNIGQDVKWDEGHVAANFTKLAKLSGTPGTHARLLIWPEAAVPFLLEEDQPARTAIAQLLGPHDIILTGADSVRRGANGRMVSATNAVLAMDSAGHLLGRYDKAHLVPFGEYLPMRSLLSRFGLSRLAPGDMDFSTGPGPRDLTLPGIGAVGVQICYEIIFPGHVIDEAHRPIVLVNPSNDAWFGRWGPPQHLAQARLRAIEEAIPVVRSTPTGISAVVDRDGRLLASLPWRTPGAIDLPLPPVGEPTLFARFGNILPLSFALLLLIAGLASRRWAG